MSQMVRVDPSISREPIALFARDLPTVCVLCSHNCGLRVDVADGRITEIRADESNPITRGYVCNKGFAIAHYAHHAQRTTHPLRRRGRRQAAAHGPDGTFERISWETAIAEISAKLVALREAHGARSIGLVGIGGQANHMDGPFGLTFLGALGSRRWYNAFAQEKTQHFLIDKWMFDSSPSSWFHPDVENARLLLVMGTNPRISNRGHAANDTFKRRGEDPSRRTIVVDPRETETTRGAERHLRVRPGSDVWLLLGIAKCLVASEGSFDARFVAERTVGFEALRAALEKVDVAAMAERCGLARGEIEETAREIAGAESAAIMFDLAVEQIPFLTLISYLIRVILVVTGNVGRTGGNHFMEAMSPPAWSPKRFEEPERALASGIPAISAIGGYGMFSPTLIPEEIEVDHPERLRALIVEGSNPVLSYSDANRFLAAREKLELLVVIDPAMTETAQLADYVLPTPCGYEKWETAGFPKGFPEVYEQLRPPVLPAPGEALPEPEIYTRLAEACGLVPEPPAELFELAKRGTEPEGAAQLFQAATAAAGGDQAKLLFWAYRTLGRELPAPSLVAAWVQCLTNAFVRRDGVLRTLGAEWTKASPFEIGMELFRRTLAHPEGVEMARAPVGAENLLAHIGHADKKIRLAPEPMLEEIGRAAAATPRSDPDYPFVLANGLRTRWTANTIQRDPSWRKGRGPHCALNLSPRDAESLGIAQGDRVRVATRAGAVELPAAFDARLQPGHVWIPNGFGARYPGGDGALELQGANLNVLSEAGDRDPFTGIPHHKYTLCRIERVAP